MGQDIINTNLRRRMLSEEGWVYFCRICGKYLPESEFYKSKAGGFGIQTKCKHHYKKNSVEPYDPEMEYLKLQPIQDDDFYETQKLLESLGYEFGPGKEPVYKQFEKKHNLNGQAEND